MPIGRLETEQDLSNFIQQVTDRGVKRLANLAAIDFGTATFTFAAATTATATPTHGLGALPTVVVALPSSSDIRLDTNGVLAAVATTTTFPLRAVSNIGALTATYTGYWIALV